MPNGTGLANLAAPGGMLGGLMNNPLLRLGLSIMAQPGGLSAGQQIGQGLTQGLAGLEESNRQQMMDRYYGSLIGERERAAQESQRQREAINQLAGRAVMPWMPGGQPGQELPYKPTFQDIMNIPGMEKEALGLMFREPAAPKTAGGLQFDATSGQWVGIPGYEEQRRRTAEAEAQIRAKYRAPPQSRGGPVTWSKSYIDENDNEVQISSTGQKRIVTEDLVGAKAPKLSPYSEDKEVVRTSVEADPVFGKMDKIKQAQTTAFITKRKRELEKQGIPSEQALIQSYQEELDKQTGTRTLLGNGNLPVGAAPVGVAPKPLGGGFNSPDELARAVVQGALTEEQARAIAKNKGWL